MTVWPTYETIDALTDLLERLDAAEVKLVQHSEFHKPLSHERIRLEGKANGVRLAASYVRESLRLADQEAV